MIRSFKHKGIERFFSDGEKRGIDPNHAARLARILDLIGKRKLVHPGYVLLEDVIKPLGITITEAALRLGVTRKTLSALLNGKASLSPEMATRIASATNTSPESWLYMQAKLDLWNVSRKPPRVRQLKAAAV